MKKNLCRRVPALLLAGCLLLSCAACGGKAAATTMRLLKTQGTVGVSDGEGRQVQLRENLMLYSGYGVGTRPESYAWINLDDVKLTKLDQDSQVKVTKQDKHLEIEVLSGSLFFNVTEPLADDETMEIRTSTIAIGIRGTCGWVTQDTAALLEGAVEVTAGEQNVTIPAGAMARVSSGGELVVTELSASDVPAFVVEEIEADSGLAAAILEDSGIDVLNPEEQGEADALAQYRAIVSQAETYFDNDYQGDDAPSISYRYALVQMQTDHQTPALVLERETVGYWVGDICNALVFQYDPNSQTVIQAEGMLSEGVASAGGYRGDLEMAGDGPGLLETSWSSGTGQGSTQRVTLGGSSLRYDTVWSGIITDRTSAGVPIPWCSVDDPSGLDSWTPDPTPPQDEAARRAALLEVLDGGAVYAGLFDMDQDGREDLLLLRKAEGVPEYYSSFRWTAYLWDGSQARSVDLSCSDETLTGAGLQSTDDMFTVTAGVYREQSTGTLYVRYYGEVVGGAYSNYFVSTAGTEQIWAPFWGGGYDGPEEGREAWQQQKDQEQREYEENLASRYETLVELTVGGFEGVEDYTYTIDEVRQRLTEE